MPAPNVIPSTHSPPPLGLGFLAHLPATAIAAVPGASAVPYLSIAGVEYATDRLDPFLRVLDDLTVTLVVDQTPAQATFTAKGFVPTVGQDVLVRLGWDRVLGGLIRSARQTYVGTPANYAVDVDVIGYAWLLSQRLVSGRFTATSATTIAQQLVTTYAPAFTTAHVQVGLAVVDEITFTNQTLAACLTQLAKRIGGYWYCDDFKDVHLFTSETGSNPVPLTVAHDSLTAFSVTRDLGQVVTRVFSEGGGGTAIAAVAVGDTQLPVSELSWYNAAGGIVAAGPQRLTYTAKSQAAPTTAPTLYATFGAGIDDGSHQWAYTFVTASGETLPSLLSAALVMETLPAGPAISVITPQVMVGGPAAGTTMSYVIAVIKDITRLNTAGFTSGITDPLLITTQVAAGNMLYTPTFTSTSALLGRQIGLFRSDDAGHGSTNYFLLGYITLGVAPGNPAMIVDDIYVHNYNTPYSSTFIDFASWTGFGQVNKASVSVVPVGPVGTTQRKVYRTTAGGAALLLQQTIANNTATSGVADATPDASLGAAVPSSDTSALVLAAVSTTSGATAAGATSLVLVSGTAFLSTGGWVIAAGLAVRYTGKSANTLTGVPATGPGSISAALPSASTVTSCPTLSGIPSGGAGSILYAIKQGDPVNLVAQADDVAAQAALAAYLLSVLGIYSDGIQEAYLQDGRFAYTEAAARGAALLALRRDVEVSIRYTVRDPLTRPGRTISVNLPAPTSVVGDFKIQTVTITHFHPTAALFPDYTVVSAPTRFSIEDLLRMAKGSP